MKDQCPVNECKEVKTLRESLKWWSGTIIVILLAISAPALYSWARTLSIPELQQDVKKHEQRLIVLEVQLKQILKNTEDIKIWLKSKGAEKCPL